MALNFYDSLPYFIYFFKGAFAPTLDCAFILLQLYCVIGFLLRLWHIIYFTCIAVY